MTSMACTMISRSVVVSRTWVIPVDEDDDGRSARGGRGGREVGVVSILAGLILRIDAAGDDPVHARRDVRCYQLQGEQSQR